MTNSPVISIIIATYNSSQVLYFAIKSVLKSEFKDWELIVVGDHCTDDTEVVIHSIDDSRIKFYNLPENSGQQAKPNNFGISKAKGKFISFLNHDDMYLPWHLDYMLNELHRSGADIVCTRYAIIYPFDETFDLKEIKVKNGGHSPYKPSFSPFILSIASTWLITRYAIDTTGPWKLENTLYISPSQDWLFRAWKNNCEIHCANRISVIALPTQPRKDFYKKKKNYEHRFIYDNIVKSETDTKYLQNKINKQEELKKLGQILLPHKIEKLMRHVVYFFLMRLHYITGLHPKAPYIMLRYGWKGSTTKLYHKRTGKEV